MTTRRNRERDLIETGLVLHKECQGLNVPPLRAADVADLLACARALSALAVAECNHGLTERQQKRRASLGRKAQQIADRYGLRLMLGGDARGSQIHVLTPRTGRYNTLGGVGEGWAL